MKKVKSGISVLMALVFLMVAFSAVFASAAENQSVTIDIVHTNDIHAESSYKADKIVGYEKLATIVKDVKADIVVDAGDTFHGQAFATIENGSSIAELIKAIGYDAITPGNHDFNYGKDRLKELELESNTKILAGNIKKDGKDFFDNNTVIKTIDGIKVGILGVFDQDIKSSTSPVNIEGLSFENDAQTATKLAADLRAAGCEIVIALSHQYKIDDFIAKISGIDAIIAGHEHTVTDNIYKDKNGKNVKVVETGSHFSNVGILSIDFDKSTKQVTAMNEKLISATNSANIISDFDTENLLNSIKDRQKVQLAKIVGTTSVELDGRWENVRIGETTLGRVLTASYLDETGADIAFENAGGIRLGRKIPIGNITFKDVIDTSPFGNYLVTKNVSGKDILSILEKSLDIMINNIKSYDEWIKTGSDNTQWIKDNGNFLQIGGMQVIYDLTKPMGSRVVSAKIKEVPLEENKIYTIATNNYIATSKTYPELAAASEINEYSSCEEILTRFIKKGENVVANAAVKVGLSEKSEEITINPPVLDENIDNSTNPNENIEIPKTGNYDNTPYIFISFSFAIAIIFIVKKEKIIKAK